MLLWIVSRSLGLELAQNSLQGSFHETLDNLLEANVGLDVHCIQKGRTVKDHFGYEVWFLHSRPLNMLFKQTKIVQSPCWWISQADGLNT